VPQPERVVGMHFFNPVHKMKLVELVRGIATDAATVATQPRLVRGASARPHRRQRIPGPHHQPHVGDARQRGDVDAAGRHRQAEDIDTALRMGFNHPMGPLELGDLTGWDTRLSVLRYLHRPWARNSAPVR
jgi:3-hydroxybutyryl-CoA dehydrogenase